MKQSMKSLLFNMDFLAASAVLFSQFVIALPGAAKEFKPGKSIRFVSLARSGLSVSLGDPVVVSVSKVGENRWGHHQFPKLSPLPDGSISADP